MVKIEVDGKTIEVAEGTRLVNAIEAHGIDILHSCGGNARCTTCKVEFSHGEPAKMTEAEKAKLAEKGLTGVRLSCQIACDHAMTLTVLNHLAGSGLSDAGGPPEAHITPEPVWVTP